MSRDAAAGHQYRHADDSPQPSESEIAPRSVFLESWRGFTNLLTRGLRELLFMASEHDPRMKDRLLPRVIWMLGVRYDLGTLAADGNATEDEPEAGNGMQEFRRDMQSRLWFTYRSGLDPIAGNLTSDAGWGCMLRSGQMMLAQALLSHNLGREWRLPLDVAYKNLPAGYRQVLEWFEDKPSAPFSVHAIARAGERVGKRAGTWLGPNTVCSALARLYEDSKCAERCGMSLLLIDRGDGDNTIYLDEVLEHLDSGPCLILLPVRLGMHTIDASYLSKVEHIFSFPQSVGFIGGRPASAHYFVASQGPAVFFLDPHTQRDKVELRADSSRPLHLSFHCDTCRRMPLHDVDPSLTFGFYLKSAGDLVELADSLSKSNASLKGYPAISVAQRRVEQPQPVARLHPHAAGKGAPAAGAAGAGGGAAAAACGGAAQVSVEDDNEDDDGFSLI